MTTPPERGDSTARGPRHGREFWRRVQEVFEQVVELDDAVKTPRLAECCAGDLDLSAAVEELLAVDAGGGRLTLEGGEFPWKLLARTPAARRGDRFGPYRLAGLLGTGGMGEVYSAERADGAYQREVAVKLLTAFADGRAAARFLGERQILANLNHPNIAMLLDGGFADGQPFLVMELVRGVMITEYSRRHRLTIEQRLDLIRQIADALGYAHRQQVVHRDIKPQNILVTEEGVPKLLDFGIAEMTLDKARRATEDDEPPLSLRLSPGYCSPEQLRGAPAGVASDVFSLGVVLFELLTGGPPFATARATLDDVRRQMEAGPPSMLDRVASRHDAERIARRRRCSRRRLRRLLAGDLSDIVERALAADPAQRYPTMEALRRDLIQWVERRPVDARRASAGYRFLKLVARRKAMAAVCAAALLVLLLFLWSRATWRRDVARQRAVASSLEDRARRSVDVLLDVVRVVDPAERPGRPLSAEEVLSRGEERARGELAEDPAALAEVVAALADSHREIGNLQRAGELAQEALDLRRKSRPDAAVGPAAVAASLDQLAAMRRLQGRFDEAEPLGREALRIQRSLTDVDQAAVARTIDNLAETLHELGRFVEAEPLYREALAMRRRHLGEDHPLVAESLAHYGLLAQNQGRAGVALSLYRQALELRRRVLPDKHPDLAESLYLVGSMKAHVGRYAAARQDLERALELYRNLYGDDHPETLLCLHDLGILHLDRGDLAEAGPILQRVLEGRLRLYPDPHPELAQSYSALASVLARTADIAGARDLIEKSAAINRRLFGSQHPYVLRDLQSLAFFEVTLDRLDSAEALLREAVAGYRKMVDPAHTDLCLAIISLGHVVNRRGRPDAESLLEEGVRCYRQSLGADHPETARAVEVLEQFRSRRAVTGGN